MFRTLVVPLDGSDLAELALPYAVRLAKVGNGRLVLHREAPPVVSVDFVDVDRHRVDTLAEAEGYLSSVAEKIAPIVPTDTTTSYGHMPAEAILRAVADNSADGIVMATHGRSGLPHLLFGSVAESVLATSTVPVLLVHARPGESPAAPFDPLAARVMVPLDGSTFAEAALSIAVELLGPAGHLVLVSIVQPPDHVEMDASRRFVVAYLDQQEEGRTREQREYLEAVAGRLRQTYPGIDVIPEVRINDQPSDGIALAAVEGAVDLVVMATHGRTGLRRAFLGSVAGGLLRTGSTPVLLVGPGVPRAVREPELAMAAVS